MIFILTHLLSQCKSNIFFYIPSDIIYKQNKKYQYDMLMLPLITFRSVDFFFSQFLYHHILTLYKRLNDLKISLRHIVLINM